MKYCPNCKIKVGTKDQICPLCQNKLSGESSSIYPELHTKKITKFLKILLFSTLVIMAIASYIDLLINKSLTFSIIVDLVSLTIYGNFYYWFTSYHKDAFSLLNTYALIILLILYIWYFVIDSKIITNFIIPIVFIAGLIFSDVAALILRHHNIQRYIKLVITEIASVIIPVSLIAFKLADYYLFIYISIGLVIVNVIGLIVFSYDQVKEELIKIFNF